MLKLRRKSSSRRQQKGPNRSLNQDYEIVGEPPLEMMLADDVVKLTMASDGVTEADIRQILQTAKSTQIELNH